MIYLKKIIPLPKDKEISLAEKPLKVLIVEDDPSMREILVEYCNNKKYITVAVESGEDALQKYNTEAPDFIILDLMLPGISGKEVLSKIRELSSNVPVIITSGFGEKEDLIDLMELRADSYLAKPFKYEKFNYLTNQAEKYIAAQWQIQAYQRELETRIREATTELELEKNVSQILETRSRLFLNNADEGMILFDGDVIDDATPAIRRMLGLSLDELMEKTIFSCVAENYKSYLAEELRKGSGKSFDLELIRKSGQTFYTESKVVFVTDHQSQSEAKLLKFWDVSKRLEHFLTGLPGERIFSDHLCSALHLGRSARYRNNQKTYFAVFYLDLNNFKKINDTYGHAEGDKKLIKVANVLKKQVRNTDTVAHPHGDEFYLLFPEMKDPEHIIQRIKMLKNVLNDNDIDASIGGYVYDFSWQAENDKKLTKEIMKNAEEQMYLAKKTQVSGSRVFVANNLIED